MNKYIRAILGIVSVLTLSMPAAVLAASPLIDSITPTSGPVGTRVHVKVRHWNKIKGVVYAIRSDGRTSEMLGYVETRKTLPGTAVPEAWFTVPASFPLGETQIFFEDAVAPRVSARSNLVPFTVTAPPPLARTLERPLPPNQTPTGTNVPPGANPALTPHTLRLECPDPAIDRIDISVLSRDVRSFEARVRISAVIKNRGLALYDSNPRQQSATLYVGDSQVGSVDFPRLAPGQQVVVSYDTAWLAAREFPPAVRAQLSYDPGIRTDGIPANDDCNLTNNRLSRPGDEVNRIISKGR